MSAFQHCFRRICPFTRSANFITLSSTRMTISTWASTRLWTLVIIDMVPIRDVAWMWTFVTTAWQNFITNCVTKVFRIILQRQVVGWRHKTSACRMKRTNEFNRSSNRIVALKNVLDWRPDCRTFGQFSHVADDKHSGFSARQSDTNATRDVEEPYFALLVGSDERQEDQIILFTLTK